MGDIPESFVKLDEFYMPDAFWDAFGYDTDSDAKWVSIYWSPYGDEAEADDGQVAGTMDFQAYLTLMRHPRNRGSVQEYDFGSSDFEAVHRMVVDLDTGDCYAAPALEAQQFVTEQWGVGDLQAVVTLTEEQWKELAENAMQAFSEIEPFTNEKLNEMMEEHRQKIVALTEALDNG